MRSPLDVAQALSACAVLVLIGCVEMSRSMHLHGYDSDIEDSTRALQASRDDTQRAAAYSQRGRAYSEKARYCRAFNLIPPDEYSRLFSLAIHDHDHAVALAPASADAYFKRGQTNYDRAALESVVNGSLVGTVATRKAWFLPATADFTKAIERDNRHDQAWDMLGLSYETIGELDEAIDAYTHEMPLNSLGKSRLADAYCTRGMSHQGANRNEAAVADYEKSIDLGANTDGCSCDPYNPLLGLYSDDHLYDKGWVVARRALAAGKWVSPDVLGKLKKESGHSN